jgi:hypothetical protein|tara:strand:+ start:6779 stop:6970 length:192 start_codon:yes stop_codon:yes gene_type:complete
VPEWDWKRRILKEKGGRRQGMEENVECGLKDFSNIPNKKAPQLQPLKIQATANYRCIIHGIHR